MGITLYIGVHDNENKEKPDFQEEVLLEVDLKPQQAVKLIRALKEIAKYLTTGERDE